jgi:DNA mismatch repair protein MutS2
VLADLPVVRIIHGKGTGVLRRVVDEVLRADRRVTAHRLAPPREGGAGVTVAELA